MVADHHDIAAIERTRGNNVLYMLVVEEATDDRLNLVLLAIAAIDTFTDEYLPFMIVYNIQKSKDTLR